MLNPLWSQGQSFRMQKVLLMDLHTKEYGISFKGTDFPCQHRLFRRVSMFLCLWAISNATGLLPFRTSTQASNSIFNNSIFNNMAIQDQHYFTPWSSMAWSCTSVTQGRFPASPWCISPSHVCSFGRCTKRRGISPQMTLQNTLQLNSGTIKPTTTRQHYYQISAGKTSRN